MFVVLIAWAQQVVKIGPLSSTLLKKHFGFPNMGLSKIHVFSFLSCVFSRICGILQRSEGWGKKDNHVVNQMFF